jgi:predicted acetyltransferase
MSLSIGLATASERPVVENLMQCYLHDFSEFTNVTMDDQGRFEYPYLDHYWRVPDRWPLLIRQGKDVVGMALVRQVVDPAGGHTFHEMAEFFILRNYRRMGLGCAAAKLIFERFSGSWQVAILKSNHEAQTFWQAVITAQVGTQYQRHDEGVAIVLCFEQDNAGARVDTSTRISLKSSSSTTH